MITYNLIGNIASGYSGESNLKNLQAALASAPNDGELCINIDCNGGSVMEGLKMYDALRNSGKNIYTNITGGCHSMAMVILLAAPAENRSANRNCRALIHRVYTEAGQINAGTADQLKQQLEMEENAILDIYEERTGRSRDDLKALMAQESIHSAEELKEYGFISKINDYSTNQYFENMKGTKSNAFSAFMEKAKNIFAGAEPMNFDYTDSEGAVVFSTEGEEDNLAVGVAVTLASGETSGTFTLSDGRVVTVEDGVVTKIEEAEVEEQEEETVDPAEVEELKDALRDAVDLIREQQATINEMQAIINANTRSTYRPRNGYHPRPGMGKGTPEVSVADLKALARERQGAVNDFKKI